MEKYNQSVVDEILSFASAGRVWPSGRKFIFEEWSRTDSNNGSEEVRTIERDWKPDIPPENILTAEDLKTVLHKANQINPTTGAPLYPNITLPIEDTLITGKFDCIGDHVSFPIRFRHCDFTDRLNFEDSHLKVLFFYECRIPHISLKRGIVDQSVVVEHCLIPNGFNLRGARISGLLGLKGSRLSDDNGDFRSLDLRNATIGANVFLRRGFISEGLADLSAATIEGSLDCAGSSFKFNPQTAKTEPIALKAKNAHIRGTVFLNQGFTAVGEVDFRRAKVGGQVTIRQAHLTQPHPKQELRRFFAVNLENTTIVQDLNLASLVFLDGDIGLQNASARNFADRPLEWVNRKKYKNSKIYLSGFKYGSISRTPRSSRTRYRWLKAVLPNTYMRPSFLRQPWDQLARTLRLIGEDKAADLVAIKADAKALEKIVFKFPSALSAAILYIIVWPFLALYYSAMRLIQFGYGLGYARIFPILFILWITNIITFGFAASEGRMKPLEEEVVIYMAQEGTQKSPPHYVQFNTIIYALDVILPIELGQQSKWVPLQPHELSLAEEHQDVIVRIINRAKRKSAKAAAEKSKSYSWFPKLWSITNIVLGWVSFIVIGAAFAGSFRHQTD